MPKMKTNKAASKRFRVTGSGKIRYKPRGMRHNLEHKKKDNKRSLRRAAYIDDTNQEQVKRLIPYK